MQREVTQPPAPGGDGAGTLRVRDPLVRVGRWGLAAAFTVAYV